jgi:hypothetical protein
MPYSRTRRPPALPTGDELTRCLAGIGISVASEPIRDADIENTLVAASIAGMDQDDLRVLALLVTWFDIHSARVNADRLTRLVAAQSPRVRAFWAALARWKRRDRRFARLARHHARRVDLLATSTDFQIARRGEDPRFADTCLRIPAGVLRDRPGDVLDSAALARHHRPYYWRLIIGPTHRADVWAALEQAPTSSAYALAAATGASYATAWTTRADFLLGARARSAA